MRSPGEDPPATGLAESDHASAEHERSWLERRRLDKVLKRTIKFLNENSVATRHDFSVRLDAIQRDVLDFYERELAGQYDGTMYRCIDAMVTVHRTRMAGAMVGVSDLRMNARLTHHSRFPTFDSTGKPAGKPASEPNKQPFTIRYDPLTTAFIDNFHSRDTDSGRLLRKHEHYAHLNAWHYPHGPPPRLGKEASFPERAERRGIHRAALEKAFRLIGRNTEQYRLEDWDYRVLALHQLDPVPVEDPKLFAPFDRLKNTRKSLEYAHEREVLPQLKEFTDLAGAMFWVLYYLALIESMRDLTRGWHATSPFGQLANFFLLGKSDDTTIGPINYAVTPSVKLPLHDLLQSKLDLIRLYKLHPPRVANMLAKAKLPTKGQQPNEAGQKGIWPTTANLAGNANVEKIAELSASCQKFIETLFADFEAKKIIVLDEKRREIVMHKLDLRALLNHGPKVFTSGQLLLLQLPALNEKTAEKLLQGVMPSYDRLWASLKADIERIILRPQQRCARFGYRIPDDPLAFLERLEAKVEGIETDQGYWSYQDPRKKEEYAASVLRKRVFYELTDSLVFDYTDAWAFAQDRTGSPLNRYPNPRQSPVKRSTQGTSASVCHLDRGLASIPSPPPGAGRGHYYNTIKAMRERTRYADSGQTNGNLLISIPV